MARELAQDVGRFSLKSHRSGDDEIGMSKNTVSRPVRVVYVTSDGAEFPVRYDAGERVPMVISAQLADGRVVSATAMPSRTEVL